MQGLNKIEKTYAAVINGKPVVVYAVPMLQDPDTQETFLAPEVAAKLFELLSLPENKSGVTQVDVYNWKSEVRVGS